MRFQIGKFLGKLGRFLAESATYFLMDYLREKVDEKKKGSNE